MACPKARPPHCFLILASSINFAQVRISSRKNALASSGDMT